MTQEICHPERSEGSPAQSAGILHSLRSFRMTYVFDVRHSPKLFQAALETGVFAGFLLNWGIIIQILLVAQMNGKNPKPAKHQILLIP